MLWKECFGRLTKTTLLRRRCAGLEIKAHEGELQNKTKDWGWGIYLSGLPQGGSTIYPTVAEDEVVTTLT